MFKNKKIILILTAVTVFAGIFLFFREKKTRNKVWIINALNGDKDNIFTERLQNEIKTLLPSGSSIILKTASKAISNGKQAEKELKNLNAELIVWGNIQNEKVTLYMSISKPACNYIDIGNSIASLVDLKNFELTENVKVFSEETSSLIKIFFEGYLQYLNKGYKSAISVWKNKFQDNPVISFYLGNAYLMLSQSGKQVKDSQLEARKNYYNIMQAVDKNKDPGFYQCILNNLGVHYLDYPFDLGSENINKAQNYLIDAVKMSPDWSNEEYGIALSNLSIAYQNIYFTSEKHFNKLVIKNFSESLRVFKENNNKELQAVAYNNLGIGYTKIKNGPKENLEKSITDLITAKKLVSSKAQPEIFYRIINNLGLAYFYKSETKKTVKYLSMSQEFFKEDSFPVQFGLIQEALGDILLNIPPSPDEGNLLEAIKCYENALRVLNADNRPLNFAQINSNLGLIYSSLKYNKRLDNLKKAEASYEKALMVLTKDLYPLQYANLKNNLGGIFVDLSILNETGSVQNVSNLLVAAINNFTEAIEIYSKSGNSSKLIMTKVNMANAYTAIPQERQKNLNKAISIYMDVLSSPDSENYYSLVANNLEMARKTLQNLEKKNEFSR